MKTMLLFLAITIFPTIAIAQLSDTTFVQRTFQSEVFGRARKVTVQLPPQYFSYAEDSFMVTYLLDGQGPHYFNMQVGNLDYQSSRYGIIPTIVVGIHTENRFKEFTPNADPDSKNNNFSSELKMLQDHLELEVMPWVKQNFRVADFSALIGHSKAGHFVLQTLFGGRKSLFDAYLAISPALAFDDYQMIRVIEQYLTSGVKLDKFLYLSSGDVGPNEQFFSKSVEMVDFLVKKQKPNGLEYHREKFSGKDHFTTVAPAVISGMVYLKNRHMLSLENLEHMQYGRHGLTWHINRFLSNIRHTEKYLYLPPMRYYSRIAGDYFDEEKYDNAAELYTWLEGYGEELRWWEIFNTGISLCKINKKEEGNKYFDLAFDKIKTKKEEYGDDYEKIIADLKRQRLENQ